MKRGLSLLLIALTVICTGPRQVQAIPAYPHPITITQRDGTQLTVRIVGDEFSHYTITTEGYTVVNNPEGDYFYARLDNQGELVATKILARPMARLTPAEQKELLSIGKQVKPTTTSKLRMSAPRQASNSSPMQRSSVAGITPPNLLIGTTAPSKGPLKSLVVLAEPSDVAFTVANPRQAFTDLLNQDGYSVGGATGSAWNYYHANSNGQFNPEFVVVGPYKVSNTTAYYAGQGGTEKVYEMIFEACRAANNAGVDFSQYAENGVIRDVFIFYAGHNQAEGAGYYTIWPHRWDVRHGGINATFNGAQLAGYACASEYKGNSGRVMASIGTFCHEFGHVLGWPDFYDTDSYDSGGYSLALSRFSLMCSGSYNNASRTPPTPTILERWMLDWATPSELKSIGNYALPPVTSDRGYLVRTGRDSEYFLLEYRGAGKNVWDRASDIGDAQGLMAYHVDYSTPHVWYYYNSINVDPSHECMKLVCAQIPTNQELNQPAQTYMRKIAFPGPSNATELSSGKIPHYRTWNNDIVAVELKDIAVIDKTGVTFRVGEVPNLKFQIEAYQQDAVVSWEDPQATGWLVNWQKIGGNSESQTVSKPQLRISNLTPRTDYEITITPQPENGNNPPQNFLFSTMSPSEAGHTAISLLKYEYPAAKPILLSINSPKPETVKWYIDGQATTGTYLTLPAGEHKITAEITTEEGDKEYIIKYIQVK